MDNKILEIYPLSFAAAEARKLSGALAPSSLDKVFYRIFYKAMRGDYSVDFPYVDIGPDTLNILRELGYNVVDSGENYEVSWY